MGVFDVLKSVGSLISLQDNEVNVCTYVQELDKNVCVSVDTPPPVTNPEELSKYQENCAKLLNLKIVSVKEQLSKIFQEFEECQKTCSGEGLCGCVGTYSYKKSKIQ